MKSMMETSLKSITQPLSKNNIQQYVDNKHCQKGKVLYNFYKK